jgi:S1-C subfamily serine protease
MHTKYVLTAHHVVKGATKVELTSLGGHSTGRVTKSDGWHTFYDLATFQLPASMSRLPEIRLSDKVLPIGTVIYVSAFPNGIPTITKGRITGYEYQTATDFPTEMTFTAAIYEGASGGMIIDSAGNLKGIVKAYKVMPNEDGSATRGDGVGTPSYLIMALIKRAVINGWRPRPH